MDYVASLVPKPSQRLSSPCPSEPTTPWLCPPRHCHPVLRHVRSFHLGRPLAWQRHVVRASPSASLLPPGPERNCQLSPGASGVQTGLWLAFADSTNDSSSIFRQSALDCSITFLKINLFFPVLFCEPSVTAFWIFTHFRTPTSLSMERSVTSAGLCNGKPCGHCG